MPNQITTSMTVKYSQAALQRLGVDRATLTHGDV